VTIPIIAVTGNVMCKKAVTYMNSGMTAVLTKPVQRKDLFDMISNKDKLVKLEGSTDQNKNDF
jgi:CheY-like chemotaxis protein